MTAVALALSVVLTACDPSGTTDDARAPSSVDSAAADSLAADSAGGAAADSGTPVAAAEPGGFGAFVDRARRAVGLAPEPPVMLDSAPRSADSAAADSAPAQLPHPPEVVGRWYHGDMRSKYGDSLSITLREDGTASATERRYTLDRSGWHVQRTEREGVWEIRYDRGGSRRLCTTWSKPEALNVCESVTLMTDTVTETPIMRYAGRHWRPRGSGRDEKDRG